MLIKKEIQNNAHTSEKKNYDKTGRTSLPHDLQTVHYRYTHRWGLPSLSLTTKGSWMHLGEGRQTSHHPLTPIPPTQSLYQLDRGHGCSVATNLEFVGGNTIS